MKNLIYIKYRDIQQNSNLFIEIMLIQKIGDSPQILNRNTSAKRKTEKYLHDYNKNCKCFIKISKLYRSNFLHSRVFANQSCNSSFE